MPAASRSAQGRTILAAALTCWCWVWNFAAFGTRAILTCNVRLATAACDRYSSKKPAMERPSSRPPPDHDVSVCVTLEKSESGGMSRERIKWLARYARWTLRTLLPRIPDDAQNGYRRRVYLSLSFSTYTLPSSSRLPFLAPAFPAFLYPQHCYLFVFLSSEPKSAKLQPLVSCKSLPSYLEPRSS